MLTEHINKNIIGEASFFSKNMLVKSAKIKYNSMGTNLLGILYIFQSMFEII